MDAYDLGDTRRLSAAFTVSDVATDPTTLTFSMRESDGTVTSYVEGTDAELAKDSTGNFHVDWLLAQVGRHTYRWIGTGSAAEGDGGEFESLPGGITT